MYFSKEELEDITNKLLENPCRETLKELNNKYNVTDEVGDKLCFIPDSNAEIKRVDVIPAVDSAPVDSSSNNSFVPTDNVSANKIDIPSIKVDEPIVNNAISMSVLQSDMPNLEMPSLEPINNNEVAFNGNLWDPQSVNVNGMMAPTDNFNNNIPVDNSNINNGFFNVPQNNIPNAIPISGDANAPSMFSQLQQNYN